MACFHPLKGYRARSGGSIVFNVSDGYVDRPVTVACGQCVGCRLERSRQWAVRCVHEAQMHDDNCFITLTYSDDRLPEGQSLVVADFQKFMKRLRKFVAPVRIRFFHCGEYGETFGRPHYHAIIFGYDFPDKVFFKKNKNGDVIYTSDLLSSIWSNGLCSVGAVTFESAAYVARYVMKKVTGEVAEYHYRFVDGDGVVTDRLPEYVTMSRRPGIASAWVQKFGSDVYAGDFAVLNGVKFRPPRFYDARYELMCPKVISRVKRRRREKAAVHADNNTPDRLKVRERVQVLKLERLKREVE